MPAPYELTPDLFTGHDDIDRQHRRLFSLANDVLVGWSATAGVRESVALDWLLGYVFSHFLAEEEVMTELGFPGRDVHLEDHAWFREEFRALGARVEDDGIDPSATLALQVLLDELVSRHILLMDRGLARFLASRGGRRLREIPEGAPDPTDLASPEPPDDLPDLSEVPTVV